MSLRSAMLKTANKLRGIPSKPSIDVNTTSVTVRTRTWVGGRIGKEGGYFDDDLEIVPRPRVREISQREITGPAGRYQAGDVRVSGITPSHSENPGIGYTEDQIAPPATSGGIEVIYVLEGAMSGEYTRVDLQTDDELEYALFLRRKRTTP